MLTPIAIGLPPKSNTPKVLHPSVSGMQVNLEDVEFVTETTLTIRGTRRRTTVPKTVVDILSLADGDKLRWILFGDGTILLTSVKRRA